MGFTAESIVSNFMEAASNISRGISEIPEMSPVQKWSVGMTATVGVLGMFTDFASVYAGIFSTAACAYMLWDKGNSSSSAAADKTNKPDRPAPR